MTGFDAAAAGFAPLALDALPRHSPWPARLIGTAGYRKHAKNVREIYREYETDKWSALLDRVTRDALRLDAVDALQFAGAQPIACSLGESLYLAPPLATRKALAGVIADALQALAVDGGDVVELGAGTGAIVTRLAKDRRFARTRFHAGDFSPSSIGIIDHLARIEGVAIRSGLFDFHADESPLQLPARSIVFTSFAVAYIQGLDAAFWRRLAAHGPSAIVVAEPIYQHYGDDTLLGLLRRGYYEANDYSREILPSIEAAEREGVLAIESVTPNVIGINPLCPVSLLVLRPAA